MVHFYQECVYPQRKIMPICKRKPKKFNAGGEARRRARELAGSPPAARMIPDKRLKPLKHKKKLMEEQV
jgi:hypothetical protein